jgi:hypothetical protein
MNLDNSTAPRWGYRPTCSPEKRESISRVPERGLAWGGRNERDLERRLFGGGQVAAPHISAPIGSVKLLLRQYAEQKPPTYPWSQRNFKTSARTTPSTIATWVTRRKLNRDPSDPLPTNGAVTVKFSAFGFTFSPNQITKRPS